MYLPQISNKHAASSVQKRQKQARPRPKHGSPLAAPSPTPTRLTPHSYSVGAKTTSPPAAKPRRPPSATPSHPSTTALLHHARADTPTSSSTVTSTATPSRLVVEAEAEPSVPEPVQPRRPAPHRCPSNSDTPPSPPRRRASAGWSLPQPLPLSLLDQGVGDVTGLHVC